MRKTREDRADQCDDSTMATHKVIVARDGAMNAIYRKRGGGIRSRRRATAGVTIDGRRHGSGRQRSRGHEQQCVGGLDETHSIAGDD